MSSDDVERRVAALPGARRQWWQLVLLTALVSGGALACGAVAVATSSAAPLGLGVLLAAAAAALAWVTVRARSARRLR